MRTFIAIDLSPDIKSSLAGLVDRLAPLSGEVKWVRQDSMHLTLKFLGETDERRVGEVESLLSSVVPKYGPISLTVNGTGGFPPGSRTPRVLWAGVQAAPSLSLLQEEIEAGCETLGFARETRPFSPHLTLGRVKSPTGLAPVLQEFEKSREAAFGEMSVLRLTFFQSKLKPSGAEYSIIREFPLK
jgi:RNA 2',3'-cyclic 3'-phosphodiesterase